MTVQKQVNFVPYAVAGILLMVPAIAMQFTKEVNWSLFDFLVAAVLLFAAAFGIDLIYRNVKNKSKSWIYILLVLFVLALIWAEMAVGIFGSPIAGS